MVYIMNHDALCVVTSFFVLYYSSMAMMIELSIIELMHYLLSWSLGSSILFVLHFPSCWI